MNRKSKQTVEWELRKQGAMRITWVNGEKHEYAAVTLGSGHVFEIGFKRTRTDEKILRDVIKRKIRRVIQGSA